MLVTELGNLFINYIIMQTKKEITQRWVARLEASRKPENRFRVQTATSARKSIASWNARSYKTKTPSRMRRK